jgi:hypothetical protein
MTDYADEAAATLGHIESRLDDIDEAMGRLDEGSYAHCQSCGRVISDERLAAEPALRWCGDCQPLPTGAQPLPTGGQPLPTGAQPLPTGAQPLPTGG